MSHRKTIMAAGAAGMCMLFVVSFVYGIASDEVLKATPEHFDFGTIDEGTPAVAAAVIQNSGAAIVEIASVRTN